MHRLLSPSPNLIRYRRIISSSSHISSYASSMNYAIRYTSISPSSLRNFSFRFVSRRPITTSTTTISSSSWTSFYARVLLVGGTAGLLTPLYALGGALHLWRAVLPRSSIGIVAKSVAALLAGGGFLAIAQLTLVPLLTHHSDLLFPFAACNSIAASFWYASAELLLGHSAIARPAPVIQAPLLWRVPWLGASIGVLTAASAPLLWDHAFTLLWPPDLLALVFDDNHPRDWLLAIYKTLFIPLTVPVALVSGLGMQTALSPILAQRTAGASTTLALILVYGGGLAYFTQCRWPAADYWWERRTDSLGRSVSVNAKTGEMRADNWAMAEAAELRRDIFGGVHWVRGLLGYLGMGATRGGGGSIVEGGRIEGRGLSLGVMRDRQALFELADILVQLKRVQLEDGDLSGGRSNLLERRLSAEWGIKSVAGLMADCEELHLARRMKGNNVEDVAQVEERLLRRFNIRDGKVFVANIEMYADLLEKELGYSFEPRIKIDDERELASPKGLIAARDFSGRDYAVVAGALASAGIACWVLLLFMNSKN